MTMRRATLGPACIFLIAALALPAQFMAARQALAQAAAPAPAAEAPADAAARAAFEAMPEADRRAIQDALVWTGDYAGITDGSFGKGTLAAIKAYQARAKAKVDGILTAASRGTLIADGAKARQAAGFTVIDDAKSGIRIGIPLKLLDQRAVGKTGAIFKAKDNSASLEAFMEDPSKTSLAELFQQGTTDPSKHITYKVLRTDFFVITGDMGGKRFFTRVASGAAGIRGFVFNFPPNPAFDRISVAIADSFVPFPEPGKPAAPGPAVALPGKPLVPPPLPHPVIKLSGLAVDAKHILTVALPEGCAAPTLAGGQAKILRSDAASGLALLERSGPDAQTVGVALRASDMQKGDRVIVLSSTADGEANVSVSTGEAPSASRILAPLQAPSGSLVFDRSGALAGIVTFQANIKRLPGGVVPEASYTMVTASAIKSFLAAANQPLKVQDQGGAEASAGAVAAKYGRALAALSCGGQP
jgi:peptidoglycan hydrolase-like protein with peptidoglycan-binding domain